MDEEEKDTSGNALNALGKRIERLLYVGMLLLALSFIELYLVDATIYFENTHVSGFPTLVKNLQSRQQTLDDLFEKRNDTVQVAERSAREARVVVTRTKLGLPKTAPKDKEDAVEKYRAELASIATAAEQEAQVTPRSLLKFIDAEISPKVLIERLVAKRTELESMKSTIWGVEVPQSIALNYFGTNLRIPARFLAIATSILLVPLIIGWLGSLYTTREQELTSIEKISDYRQKFPHILNLFPIQHVRISEALPKLRPSTGDSKKSAILLTIFRSVVILVFAAPMVGIFSSSAVELSVNVELPIWFYWLVWISAFVMAMQTLLLVVQEWILPYRKEFKM